MKMTDTVRDHLERAVAWLDDIVGDITPDTDRIGVARAEIEDALELLDSLAERERAFLTGKRAGREDMRERAANAAYTAETGHCLNAQDHALSGIIRGAIAKAIRALGVDDE